MDQAVFEPALADAQQAGRFDLYAGVHKALRLYMTDTLARVGRADPADDDEVAGAIGQLRDLLELCDLHIEDENRFVLPALEARRPGVTERNAEEHVSHGQAISALRREAAIVERCTAADRPMALLALYRRLGLFVAENFEHMHYEETRLMPALWAEYPDEALMGIEAAIVESIPPMLMARALHWFLPALPHPERVGMLSGMRENAPPGAFAGALEIARERLTLRDWQRLAEALGLPSGDATVAAVAATVGGLRIAERW